jgi:acetyltransferase-like isoleucine patch superfamily enzyme
MSADRARASIVALVWEKLVHARDYARARFQLRGAHFDGLFRGRVYSGGKVVVTGASGMSFAPRVFFRGGMIPTELECAPGAELAVGADTGFNYGVSIVARTSVRIGARCLFGSMVRVSDDDGMSSAPVAIGDDVWIAYGAIVCPGVVIGDGAVVAAGSVVTSAVPARTLAVGNPARCIPLEVSARVRPREASSR